VALPAIAAQEENRDVGSVSRAIPGIHAPRRSLSRTPQSSVMVDASFRRGDGAETETSRRPASFLEVLLTVALPTASANGDRWRLAKSVIADLLIVLASLLVVHIPLFVRMPWPADRWQPVGALWSHVTGRDLGVALIYGALITLLAYSERLFEGRGELSQEEEWYVLCRSVALATILVAAGTWLSGWASISGGMLLAAGALNLVGMSGRRAWARHVEARTGSSEAKRVLIAGAGCVGRELAEYLEQHKEFRRSVCGFLEDDANGGSGILGRIVDLPQVARAEFADEVIIAMPGEPEVSRMAVLEALRHRLDVRIVPELFGCLPHRMRVERIGPHAVIPLHEEPIPMFGLVVKRIFDVGVSATLLALTVPLMAVVALAVKLESPGPVLYLAPRAGKKGQRFLCCKFRTMCCDADAIKNQLRQRNERQGPLFKIVGDPRITRVGRFLRRYSLDELPQLWNVLKGEMSLVGPRPHPLDDYQQYDLEDLRRLDVIPGITGLWQVTARGDPSFQKNMALDLEYIERWSLGMDLRILLKTFAAVWSGSGA
jgi:exopolysaccharide biosynthesis polyprenyl glycosylphosphotransferase